MSGYTSEQFCALINKIQRQRSPFDKRSSTLDLQNLIIDNKILLSAQYTILLVNALEKNPNVEVLNLSGVKISYPAIEILKNHVRKNIYLHTIHVECMFSDAGRQKLTNELNALIEKNNQQINDLCANDLLLSSKKNGLLSKNMEQLHIEFKAIQKRNKEYQKQLKSLCSIFSKIRAHYSKKQKELQKKKRKELINDIDFLSQTLIVAGILIENKEKSEQLEKIKSYQQNINEIVMQGYENSRKVYKDNDSIKSAGLPF